MATLTRDAPKLLKWSRWLKVGAAMPWTCQVTFEHLPLWNNRSQTRRKVGPPVALGSFKRQKKQLKGKFNDFYQSFMQQTCASWIWAWRSARLIYGPHNFPSINFTHQTILGVLFSGVCIIWSLWPLWDQNGQRNSRDTGNNILWMINRSTILDKCTQTDIKGKKYD